MYKNLVLIDGEIMPAEQATVSLQDRGHQFGDGVFEIVPVYNGRCFAVLPHMDNLFESVIKVKIPAVYTIEELVEFHEQLISASGIENGEIYTQITRGTAEYGLAFPEMSVPQLTMTIVPTDWAALQNKRETGVNIVTTEDLRWQFCNVNTLNRLPEVLARQKARESNAFDTLFVRENGKITETTESSFMVIKDEMIWTHPENNLIHKNITRRLVKERLAADLEMQVIEKAFDMDFVLTAEEAFLCGPRCEIIPVTKIDRKFIGSGVGKIVPQLAAAYQAFVKRECPSK